MTDDWSLRMKRIAEAKQILVALKSTHWVMSVDRLKEILKQYRMTFSDFDKVRKERSLETWEQYISLITGWHPCPVCGGPQIVDPHLAGVLGSRIGLRCVDDIRHFYAWWHAPKYATRLGVSIPDAMLAYLDVKPDQFSYVPALSEDITLMANVDTPEEHEFR